MAYKKADSNQREIVAALRELGCSVVVLAGMGLGVPDLLIGWRGANYLVEVKNLAGRGDRFTAAEHLFMDTWRGNSYVVHSIDEALELFGVEEMSENVRKCPKMSCYRQSRSVQSLICF